MTKIPTRRDFIKGLAAGGALCGVPPFPDHSRAAASETATGRPAGSPFDRNVVEAEIRRRAEEEFASGGWWWTTTASAARSPIHCPC